MRITNTNKLIEEKVNYFISSFNYFLSNAGSTVLFELESQLSLLKKIDFHLTNDKEYRLPNMDIYFKNPLFNEEIIWNEYKEFEKTKKNIDLYNKLTEKEKKEKFSIIDSSKFQQAVKDLIIEIEHYMPNRLHKCLMTIFQCEKSLQDHNHISQLDLLARLIISGGFYSGKTLNEIHSLMVNTFDRRYAFPYPEHIKTLRDRKKFDQEKSLSNQILGIISIVRKDIESGIVIMRLSGGDFPDDFDFSYNGVHFLGKSHPKILKIRERVNNKFQESLFQGDNFIFICSKLTWWKRDSISQRMKLKTAEHVNFLSSVCKRELNIDITGNLFITNLRWKYIGGLWSSKLHRELPDDILEQLKYNPFNLLAKVKDSNAKFWFLSLEPLFVNASKNSSMVDYWIYLEALFSCKQQNKRIKDITSSIILLNERQFQLDRIFHSLQYMFSLFNSSVDKSLFSHELEFKIYKMLNRRKIPKEIKTIPDEFLQALLREYKIDLDKQFYSIAKEYYYNILVEAYSHRNFYVHSGIINEDQNIKLEKILPLLCRRIRYIIIQEISKNPRLPFNILIDNLENRAKELFQ
ncbi:hypothetical protein [Sphingobacterium puteale]|uniref:hypothetical protein n=1 Tax=Sphingobacterium puteale TaxID=2420510 RepID=UPI003D997DA3